MKIVRDLVAARIPPEALTTAADAELPALLAAKIHEEVDEIVASSFADVVEFADALEALQALAAASGHDWGAVERTRLVKASTHGGFSGRHIYHPERDSTRP